MNLIEGAISNKSIATDIANAITAAATQTGVASDPTAIVQAALTNAAFGAALLGSLTKIAADNQLTFTPPQATSVPIAMLFVAAALIFIPSIFKTTGGTMFGDGEGQVAGVDGITTFG